jgi:hypothetical protein
MSSAAQAVPLKTELYESTTITPALRPEPFRYRQYNIGFVCVVNRIGHDPVTQ